MEYVGIYGGLTIGLLGWFFGRQSARKKRGLDEMHEHIWRKARSTSWYVTAATIYVLMTLELLGISLGLIPALAILLFVQLSSWAIAGALYSARLTGHSTAYKPSVKLTVLIGLFILLFFSIVSAITSNWKFLLAALPPITLNILITIALAKKGKDSNID